MWRQNEKEAEVPKEENDDATQPIDSKWTMGTEYVGREDGHVSGGSRGKHAAHAAHLP